MRAAEAVRVLASVAVFMPKKPAKARADGPQHKRDGDQPVGVVLCADRRIGDAQQHGDNDDEHRQRTVLARQKGHGAGRNPTADHLHAFIARILATNPASADHGVNQSQYGYHRNDINDRFHIGKFLLLVDSMG